MQRKEVVDDLNEQLVFENLSPLETARQLDADSQNYPTRYANRFLALCRKYDHLSDYWREEIVPAASSMLNVLRTRTYGQTGEKTEALGFNHLSHALWPEETPKNAVQSSRYKVCLGLSDIPSPSAQLLVAEEIAKETDRSFRRRITPLLIGYGIDQSSHIEPNPLYPETVLHYLTYSHPDWPDLGLCLVRNNPIKASNSEALAAIENHFAQKLAEATDPQMVEEVLSDIASLAQHSEEEVSHELIAQAAAICTRLLDERLAQLSKPGVFAATVERNAQLNIFEARRFVIEMEGREEKLHNGQTLKEATLKTLVEELIVYEYMPIVYLSKEGELLDILKRLGEALKQKEAPPQEEKLRLLSDLTATRSRELLPPLVLKNIENQKKREKEETDALAEIIKRKTKKEEERRREQLDLAFQNVETQKGNALAAKDHFPNLF
jgi:hypothetical protein